MCKHIHAELMAEYAKDAAKTDKPWELWEFLYNGRWMELTSNPNWLPLFTYRRKPEPTDLEKYGVEAGDVWLLEESNVFFNYLVTGAYFDITGIVLGTGKRETLELREFENTLVFRRGVVNKL